MEMVTGQSDEKSQSKSDSLDTIVDEIVKDRALQTPPLLLVPKAKVLSSGYKYVENMSCDLLFSILSVCDPTIYNLDKFSEVLGTSQKNSHDHKSSILNIFNAAMSTKSHDPLPTRYVASLVKAYCNKYDSLHGARPSMSTTPAPTVAEAPVSPPKTKATAIVTITKTSGLTKKKRVIVPDIFDELVALLVQTFGVKAIKDLEDKDACSVEDDNDVLALLHTTDIALKCHEEDKE